MLNLLHKLGIVSAVSDTNEMELAALSRYAKGATLGVEIGSSQGVSAAIIANSLASEGVLICVDPWLRERNRENPVFQIFQRHTWRTNTATKIRVIRDFSSNVADKLP